VLCGAVNDGNWYFELIQDRQQAQHLAPELIFGLRYCDAESISRLTPVGVELGQTSAPELSLATGASS